MRKLLICALLGLPATAPAEKPVHPQKRPPASSPTPRTTLTVYSGGYAFVEVRQLLNFAGSGTAFLEVASTVVPDSIVFTPLDSGIRLMEQRYLPGRKFDAASVLRSHIGNTVKITGIGGMNPGIEGTLVNADGHLVVATKNGIEIVRDYRHIQLPGSPAPNGRTGNGIYLRAVTDKPGEHDTRLFYEAGGIGWKAHYNAVLRDTPAGISVGKGRFLRMDLRGQATITNSSDNDYDGATVRLVAGDVRRQRGRRGMMPGTIPRLMGADDARGGFGRKAFFEHHLYTLGRSMSLPKRSSVQTELFPVVSGMDAEKIMVFNASPGHVSPYPAIRPDADSAGSVDVSLRFKNTSGRPWPAGMIRFSKMDDDNLIFVGEGAVGHTPDGGSVSMSIGTAFDVRAERKLTGFDVRRAGNEVVEITENFETTIRNHKDTSVTVYVRETMWRWLTKFEFGIDNRKRKHGFKSDVPGRAVEIELRIPSKSKATAKYEIRYHR